MVELKWGLLNRLPSGCTLQKNTIFYSSSHAILDMKSIFIFTYFVIKIA